MTADDDLGRLLAELQRKVEVLERASQAQHSTIETAAGTVGLGDAAGAAVDTAAALPAVETQAVTAQETADSVAVLADDWDADLDARFEDAAADLDNARAALEDSQSDIEDAFGQTVDALSEDVETAIVSAGAATQSAEYAQSVAAQATKDAASAASLASTAKTAADDANSAALSASGLAASKGEVIVQVSAPTGSRASTANLWVDISLDSNGKPKNTPNRYNASTSKWEPITDQKVIDAAAVAAAANTAAASAASAASAADTKAQSAQSAANAAQTSANNAGQAAAAAQTTADVAKTNASAAQGTADIAKNDAAAAQARADLAAFATFSSERDVNRGDSWLRAVYPVHTVQDDVPAYAMLLGTVPIASTYVQDSAALANGIGDDYVGFLRTTVRVNTTRTVNITLTHDDGARFYVDGVSIYSWSAYAQGVVVPVTLTAGWHVIDLLWAEQAGGDGIFNISPTFRSQVDEMYAPVSLQSRAADAASALSNAATAQTAADQAKTNAATAQSTADTAKTNAATAQTAADRAKTAADAAQSTATQAKTDAANAKTAADNANSQALAAAGIANGKGKVIVQVSAPTGANAAAENLWIDISTGADGKPKNAPNRWNPSTSKWEVITDKAASDAAAAAASAQQAATAAANAASAAQATADGKPLILFSSTAGPSGTAPTGSIWFLWDSGKNVAGQWLQSGTLASPVWTPQQIKSEVIAGLDVAKLTAGSAAIAELVAQKIAASTANFQTANVSNLFVTSGATLSQAVIDFLFANVVQAKKITAGMIDVATLSGVTITGARIKSAASGQRVELAGTQLDFYDPQGGYASAVRGWVVGNQSRGVELAVPAASGYGAAGRLSVSTQRALPNTAGSSTTVDVAADAGVDAPNMVGRQFWAKSTDGNGRDSVARVLGMGDDAVTELVVGRAQVGSFTATQGATVLGSLTATSAITAGGLVTAAGLRLADGSDPLADTGWKAIPSVPSGINSFAYYRVIGNRVHLRGSFQRPNQAQFVNGYTPVGTLPTGARPSQYMRAALSMYNGITGNLIIGTDGYMQVGASTGATADTVYVGGITFLND